MSGHQQDGSHQGLSPTDRTELAKSDRGSIYRRRLTGNNVSDWKVALALVGSVLSSVAVFALSQYLTARGFVSIALARVLLGIAWFCLSSLIVLVVKAFEIKRTGLTIAVGIFLVTMTLGGLETWAPLRKVPEVSVSSRNQISPVKSPNPLGTVNPPTGAAPSPTQSSGNPQSKSHITQALPPQISVSTVGPKLKLPKWPLEVVQFRSDYAISIASSAPLSVHVLSLFFEFEDGNKSLPLDYFGYRLFLGSGNTAGQCQELVAELVEPGSCCRPITVLERRGRGRLACRRLG